MASTRKKTRVPFVGYTIPSITGARLPSGRDILRNLYYFLREKKLTLQESAEQTCANVMPFWEKSRLPATQKPNVMKKIRKLYNDHRRITKNLKRKKECEQLKRRKFCSTLDSLFDISHANSERLVEIREDLDFLHMQQNGRKGSIAGVDLSLANQEKRKAERLKRLKKYKEKRGLEEREMFKVEKETSVEDNDDHDSDSDYTVDEAPVKKKRRILSQSVCATLDRTNTSVRKSAMVMASVLNEVGTSTSATVLSKSTVHQIRQQQREKTASKIREDFVPTKCVVHWDGKLLPEFSKNSLDSVDRLPVLVTSLQNADTKLLGVPALPSGTGKNTCDAVSDILKSWECDPFTVGMCFDTTAANTGRKAGAATLLEHELGRDLLWLSCRHHMLEVLLSDVFAVCFGPSRGADIPMFNRFKQKWTGLVHHRAPTRPLIEVSESLKLFIQSQLQQSHAREDYLELLQLAGLATGLDIQVGLKWKHSNSL